MTRRELPPTSPFAGDDGACAAPLASALAVADPARRVEQVVGVLAAVRVLVPVVAHAPGSGPGADPPAGEACADDVRGDHASAAVVTVAGPDGRSVLPVFSSVETMRLWDAAARPVPVAGPRAALAAVTDADGLLVLDPAGPVAVALPRPAVWALAQGRGWLPALQDPEVSASVERALAVVDGLVAVRCEGGRGAELAVVLVVRPGLGRAGLDAVVAAASRALAASAIVADRVDTLELRVVSAAAAGVGQREQVR